MMPTTDARVERTTYSVDPEAGPEPGVDGGAAPCLAERVSPDELGFYRDLETLLGTGLSVRQAAMQLGVTEVTIRNRLQKHGLKILRPIPRVACLRTGFGLNTLLAEGMLVLQPEK